MPQFLGDDYDDDERKLFEAISAAKVWSKDYTAIARSEDYTNYDKLWQGP